MENSIARIEAHQKRIDEMNGTIEIGPNGTSLDLLQVVYRDSSLPLTTRMRAAIAALNYELPRLQVTAQITDNDVATILDRRIAHYEQMKLIEAQPATNGQPVQPAPTNGDQVKDKPTPAPLARLYDTRRQPKLQRGFLRRA